MRQKLRIEREDAAMTVERMESLHTEPKAETPCTESVDPILANERSENADPQ
jgi:hypothetical protein